MPPFKQPAWDGSPLDGKTIVLFAEQGLGDVLQFIRYAPLVKQRRGKVIVACHEQLLPLLRRCPHGMRRGTALRECRATIHY